MEEEINYLSEKIKELESKLYTLESNIKNFTTIFERKFYKTQRYSILKQKDILESILKCVLKK